MKNSTNIDLENYKILVEKFANFRPERESNKECYVINTIND